MLAPSPTHDPGTVRLAFHGAELVAEPSGALWWPATGTLIVADLHLEKGSSYARRGVLLPPYDTRQTLARLAQAVARPGLRRVICLGDSFHDDGAADRLDPEDERALARLTATCEWIWIAGNHDPRPPEGLGGRIVAATLALGPLTFRHAAGPLPRGEVSGHYHPKISVHWRGRRLAGRCFVLDDRRLVLPAFGAYAGGLDVREPDLRRLFAQPPRIYLIARERVTNLTGAASLSGAPLGDYR
jgi:DNA ligase-associated metallophosphoesterase